MILTFSWDRFVDLIRRGQKIHTIRLDPGRRWKPDRKIHFWRGNPRNPQLRPYPFAEGICSKVSDIAVDFRREEYTIDSKKYSTASDRDHLARNDGFVNWLEMAAMFDVEVFTGRLIYWDTATLNLFSDRRVEEYRKERYGE
ncbi:MAG: hypothetical protein ACLFQX_04000 [Candidatus Kapaibacterium sp.]